MAARGEGRDRITGDTVDGAAPVAPTFEVRHGDFGARLVMDGALQSQVDLDDPTILFLEYMQYFALVIDALPAGPLGVTHVGGSAMAMARYVQATRPGSPQIVLEPHVAMTEAVRAELPLPRGHRIRVRPQTGEVGVPMLKDASADVVIVDAFAGGLVVPGVTTREFVDEVRRVLKPGGIALWNAPDAADRRYLARVARTVDDAGFTELGIIAHKHGWSGKRFANYVIVGGTGGLDIAAIRRKVAAVPLPTMCRFGAEIAGLVRSAQPLTEADPQASPEFPDVPGWRH